MKDTLVISSPQIINSNGLTRMVVSVTDPDLGKEDLFIEVEEHYGKYLVSEYLDAFVFFLIPIAVRKGFDIYCDSPVSERFLHNINSILLPALYKGDKTAKKVSIFPNSIINDDSIINVGGHAVATSVTCGVDSTYTIKKYSSGDYIDMELSHLFVGSLSLDLENFDDSDDLFSWEQNHPYNFQRYNKISEMLGLPIVKCFTNIMKYMKYVQDLKHVRTHTYITMAAVMSLKKLFKIYFFPSSYPYTQFSLTDNLKEDTGHYELLLMQVMSDPGFMCYSSGAEADRIKKTEYLLNYPVAHKTLHPCFNKKINCSKPECTKCLRALMTFDYYGKLDDFSDIFDTKRYINKREDFIKSLIKFKGHGFSGFKELYDMFNEKEPDLVKKIEIQYQKSIEPVSRQTYNKLKTAFEIQTFLLKQDRPNEKLIEYFKSKGIEKIYFTGNSVWGNILLDWLNADFQIFRDQPDIVDKCDIVVIVDSAVEDRKKAKKQFNKMLNGEGNLITFHNIEKILNQKN